MSFWRGLFGPKEDRIRVHLVLKGRMGPGWYDRDEKLAVPAGTTLTQLVAIADQRGWKLSQAIADSPHAAETLMWNGSRCPLAEHGARTLEDGDRIYLLGPLAGG